MINKNFQPMSTYEQLKELAISENISASSLIQLKQLFTAEIESERRRDFIHSIADLIDCLERRDALSEHNVNCLQKLAEHCESMPLLKALTHYDEQRTMQPLPARNQYRQLHMTEQMRIRANAVSTSHSSGAAHAFTNCKADIRNDYNEMTPQKRLRIYKLLASELGKDWRNFGRELNLSLTVMDEIELEYPRDLSERVHRILQLFEAKEMHPEEHAKLIKNALNDCQRKDLRRKVDAMLQK